MQQASKHIYIEPDPGSRKRAMHMLHIILLDTLLELVYPLDVWDIVILLMGPGDNIGAVYCELPTVEPFWDKVKRTSRDLADYS